MTPLDKTEGHKPGTPAEPKSENPRQDRKAPAAGAHAADHLTNEDATPGAGALTSRANASGREVDGGAG